MAKDTRGAADQPLTKMQKVVEVTGLALLLMAIFLPRFFTQAWIDFLGSAFGGAATVALMVILAAGQCSAILAGRIYTVWRTERRMVKMVPPLALCFTFAFVGAASSVGVSGAALERRIAQAQAAESLASLLPIALYLYLGGLFLAVAVDVFAANVRHGFWLTMGVLATFWTSVAVVILP